MSVSKYGNNFYNIILITSLFYSGLAYSDNEGDCECPSGWTLEDEQCTKMFSWEEVAISPAIIEGRSCQNIGAPAHTLIHSEVDYIGSDALRSILEKSQTTFFDKKCTQAPICDSPLREGNCMCPSGWNIEGGGERCAQVFTQEENPYPSTEGIVCNKISSAKPAVIGCKDSYIDGKMRTWFRDGIICKTHGYERSFKKLPRGCKNRKGTVHQRVTLSKKRWTWCEKPLDILAEALPTRWKCVKYSTCCEEELVQDSCGLCHKDCDGKGLYNDGDVLEGLSCSEDNVKELLDNMPENGEYDYCAEGASDIYTNLGNQFLNASEILEQAGNNLSDIHDCDSNKNQKCCEKVQPFKTSSSLLKTASDDAFTVVENYFSSDGTLKEGQCSSGREEGSPGSDDDPNEGSNYDDNQDGSNNEREATEGGTGVGTAQLNVLDIEVGSDDGKERSDISTENGERNDISPGNSGLGIVTGSNGAEGSGTGSTSTGGSGIGSTNTESGGIGNVSGDDLESDEVEVEPEIINVGGETGNSWSGGGSMYSGGGSVSGSSQNRLLKRLLNRGKKNNNKKGRSLQNSQTKKFGNDKVGPPQGSIFKQVSESYKNL